MSWQQQSRAILLNALPLILMVGLIPLIHDDLLLTALYGGVICIALMVRSEPRDWLFLTFGFLIMIIAEYFFVSTGVETFTRRSLFGCMPLWLPVLWAYGFVAMRRAIGILER